MSTSTLESRNYVATEADIGALAEQINEARDTTDTIPRIYLRAVVATTIHELGAPIRVRAAKTEKIDEAEQTRQLATLDQVVGRFYPIVVERESRNLPTGKDRARVLNSRTNWARSVARDVRNWIRAGHSLTTLAPSRLILAAIKGAVKQRARPPSPARVRKRVETQSKVLVAGVMELASVDKGAAIAEIELLMGQLAGQLAELGVAVTKDPKQAATSGQLLRVGRATFFPTSTQVIRQQAAGGAS